MRTLRIGTRRSALALTQANLIAEALKPLDVSTELVEMTTTGDERGPDDAPLEKGSVSLKGLWIDTILDALASGEIDLAVHSAKDLPSDDPAGTVIAAVPKREDPADWLVSRTEKVPDGARIGTSSIRRSSQLLSWGRGYEVVPFRGNVDTRISKIERGDVDAGVLAAAGITRLGIEPRYFRKLTIDEMVPAPCQGCIAVQARDGDHEVLEPLAFLDDPGSHLALRTERSLVSRIGGGCSLPLGALAKVTIGSVHMVALVASEDGSRVIRVEAETPDPERTAEEVAAKLLAGGAAELLEAYGE